MLPTYYRRARRYLERGPRHFLMYVFGRFGVIRSLMVWLHSQRKSKPALSASSSLVDALDVDDVVLKISQDGFCPGLASSAQGGGRTVVDVFVAGNLLR
jgi:hypothetical protein